MGDPLTTKNALATKFIAYELPADFVQDFAGDRAAVTAVIGRLIRAGVKEVNIVDVTHATHRHLPPDWHSAIFRQ